MRPGMTPMDDQVSDIRNPGKGVGKDEDGISSVEEGVTEQQQRAGQAEPPKGRRDHHSLKLLRGIPLDEKTREEDGVAEPANDFPGAPGDSEEFAVMPHQVGEPIHTGAESRASSQNRKLELKTGPERGCLSR